MVSVCPPILAPESQNCSGRGICVDEFTCECQVGWTGKGDFAFGSPSCGIHIDAVRSLWAIVAILNILALVFSAYYIRVKLAQTIRTKAPLALGFILGLENICIAATGIIRAANPSRTIGSDVLVTVVFTVGTSLFWCAAHVFIYSFIELGLKQSRIFQHTDVRDALMRHMRLSLPISAVVSVCACLTVLGMLGSTSAEVTHALATSHYLISAFVLALTGFWLTPSFISQLRRDIDSVASKQSGDRAEMLNRITSKMTRFESELKKQAVSNTVFAVFMGFWPLVQIVGSSYFLPFAWSSGAIVSVLSLYLNLPVHDGKSSTQKSSTVKSTDNSSVRPLASANPRSPTALAPNSTLMMDSFAESGTNFEVVNIDND